MKKRIAIDCRLWKQGGVGRYIRNLVWNLSEFDTEHDYTFFCMSEDEKELREEGLTVSVTKAHWHSMEEQVVLWRQLEAGNFDLVHFPYFSHPIFYNKPFVSTVHDLTIMHFPTGKATTKHPLWYQLKRHGYHYALRHAVFASRHVIAPTQFVKNDILAHFGVDEKKITVTYEGVDREFMAALTQKNSSYGKNYFLYVGNFYPHKNVEFLLKVLCGMEKNVRFVFVGPDDFFSKRFKQTVHKMGLDNRVEFMHNVSNGELHNLYARAQALVLPSLFEGFGLPVIEASYFKCPVILSDIPVFREVAPDNSVFFDPHNVDECIRALKNIKPVKIQNSYFERFSFKRMALQTRDIYKAVLAHT